MSEGPPTPGSGLVVAVDGTSGSGKSSTSRAAAARLGLRYLDTGAMFRAMTWWLLQQGVDVTDLTAVTARCGEPEIRSGTDPRGPTIVVDGHDVSAAIRTDEVNAGVSHVAAVPAVRARLLELQRALIDDGGIVVEGRDIGSVVWPHAQVKLYLTADPVARARRRALEAGAADLEATRESLLSRDRIDSGRETAPLVMADGAVHLDTTPYSLEEVVDLVVSLAEATEERR